MPQNTLNKDIIPEVDWLSAKINKDEILRILNKAEHEKKWVILLVVGTKPDFYKQYPIIYWANKFDIPLILITTGQHHDSLLSYGLTEFNMDPLVDLQIRGNLFQKGADLFYKMGNLARWFHKIKPNVTVLPIPHGDTLSAAITASAWFLSIRQGVGQNEAGLRSMAPNIIRTLKSPFTPDLCEEFLWKQWDDEWFVIRNEPYPEQWDTFVCGAGASYFFAPHAINVEHLLRERYPGDRIIKVGNSVVDAIDLHRKPEKSIFDMYPLLDDYDNWLRVDIHRRENLGPRRFLSLVKTIPKLLEKGIPIIWVELNATKESLQHYGLREEVLKWAEKFKHFQFTPLWQSYGNVLEFWKSGKCLMELTDSGSIQEELNELRQTFCCTIRFSTDRPESIFDAHSNLLAPPYSEEILFNLVNHIINSESLQKSMRAAKKIYGENVGKKIIEHLIQEMNKNAKTFRWTHQTLYNLPDEEDLDYL